ncbi:MAG: GumC family protein [Hyphomicrobiaceae bacterium]
MTQRNDATHGNEEVASFGLRDLIAACRNRWPLIATLTVLGTIIAALVATSLPNRYEAIATVQIDPRKKTIVSVDAVLPDIAGDTPTIESQVEILHSKYIALRVIDALKLREDPEFNTPSLMSRLRRYLPFLPKPAPVMAKPTNEAEKIATADAARSVTGPSDADIGADNPGYDDVAAEFSDRLRTWRVRNSLIVEIHFSAASPIKAARIANAIAEVYIRDQIEAKIKATEIATQLLQKKIEGLRSKVNEAELKVTRFKAANGIFDTGKEPLADRELASLMEQTILSRNATANARAHYEQLQRTLKHGDGANLGEVLQSNTVRMLKEQLVRATSREAELITKYGPRHPELIRARADRADVESQLRREMGRIIENVKNDYEVALKRQQMLENNPQA